MSIQKQYLLDYITECSKNLESDISTGVKFICFKEDNLLQAVDTFFLSFQDSTKARLYVKSKNSKEILIRSGKTVFLTKSKACSILGLKTGDASDYIFGGNPKITISVEHKV